MNEYTYHTWRLPCLVWVFAGRTCHCEVLFHTTIYDSVSARQQQPSYAFSVYDLSRARPSRVGDILVFTKTHLNEDGLYSTTTGKYTTSVNGIYVFHATLTSDISNKNIHVEFKAGGNAIGRFAVVDTASDITSSGSATARLQKGTEVYLRVTYVSSGYRFREDGHYMNSFSGYLISK